MQKWKLEIEIEIEMEIRQSETRRILRRNETQIAKFIVACL